MLKNNILKTYSIDNQQINCFFKSRPDREKHLI
jgi:hypothetical protein